VSNSYCEYVVARAQEWLTESAPIEQGTPFLLTAGFFETHRPYPRERYEPAETADVDVPDFLPDTPEVRGDLAEFYGSIAVADAAVGRLLDTLADTGLDNDTWVVFLTDHGPAFPRAKSTLYDAGTGIATIIRPPRRLQSSPVVYDELFSGVDLVPTLLELVGITPGQDIEGLSHARNLLAQQDNPVEVRDHVYTEKTYHDSYDPIRAIRTKKYSYIENYAQRPLLDLPLDIEESPSGQAVEPFINGPRPARELYDLEADPSESTNLLVADASAEAELVAEDLAVRLDEWRQKTGDVIPSEFVGTRIAARYTETYFAVNGLTLTSRSAIASERGLDDEVVSQQ
jgi:arylsulfatase A-like enzyme